jgi:hypothetical protein
MPNYASPTFTAVPMATICSKIGCGIGPPQLVPISATANKGTGYDPTIVLAADLDARADAGRLFVYEPKVQLVFELNEVGADVILTLASQNKLSGIVGTIQDKYNGTPSNVADEIWGFLQALAASGFGIGFTD